MENRHELRQMAEDVVVRPPLDHAGECDDCPAVDEDVDLEVQLSLRAHEARDQVYDEDEAHEEEECLDRVTSDGLDATDVRDLGDQDDPQEDGEWAIDQATAMKTDSGVNERRRQP